MTAPILRTIAAHERDAVLDLLAGWWGDPPGTPGRATARAFFARYLVHDPTYRDDLCFVAEHDGRLISTLQVFRKQVQVDGAVLEIAGLGNVFTDPTARTGGVASALLEQAIGAMATHGFDASLLFAEKLDFYARLGWRSTPRHLAFLAKDARHAAPPPGCEPFVRERDLDAVRGIYAAHSAPIIGATVRDRAYWQGQLAYAGNPGERFLIVRRDATVVAYARATELYGMNVITEYGALVGEIDVLAGLIAHQQTLGCECPGTLVQIVPDTELERALLARAVPVRHVDDPSAMWRLVNAEQLAAKLRVSVDVVQRDGFFAELVPVGGSRYWISDRF
ncbi:MAG: GNAT family N-acetyltransferase [Deltaproteobacteria bacterium]|nr:GNAT family N-acetyltransferase [Deltaproteobacteria bacterium]